MLRASALPCWVVSSSSLEVSRLFALCKYKSAVLSWEYVVHDSLLRQLGLGPFTQCQGDRFAGFFGRVGDGLAENFKNLWYENRG